MNRIKNLFSKPGEKLVPFFTAGYPNFDSIIGLVLAAADIGADMVEIGIPYSDPLADGPVIQASNQQALKNGITLEKIFKQVATIRQESHIPIALMGYINPILRMGSDRFLDRCVEAGVDGLILPDLPLDEANEFCTLCKFRGLSPILLVAPNTTNARIRLISKMAGDLIYAISILGITGNSLGSKEQLETYLQRVRKNSATPFVVGFGIRNRQDVIFFNQYANGTVVGSAIIEKLNGGQEDIKALKNYLRELKGKV